MSQKLWLWMTNLHCHELHVVLRTPRRGGCGKADATVAMMHVSRCVVRIFVTLVKTA